MPVGAMYGLAASGLVVVHRATRQLDLSLGAAATAAAFTVQRLRVDTELVAPLAVAAGLAVAAAIGFLAAALARRIGPGRPLASVVGSLALAGVVLAVCTGVFGTETQFAPPWLGGVSLDVVGTVLSGQQLLVVAAAVTVVAAGSVLLRRSWTGQAWAGLAGDRTAGLVVGLPVGRLETTSYVVAAVLAGGAGILLAPLLFLDTVQMTVFFLVKPFAAAMVAGLARLPVALAVGLAIGVVESVLVKAQSVPGLGEAVPFFLVVAAACLPAAARRGGRRLSGLQVFRGVDGAREAAGRPLATGPSRIPGRGAVWPAAALVAVLLAAGPHLSAYWSTILQLGAVTAVVASSHVVLTGWAGQLSLATPGLAGIGAIVAARSATEVGLPFPVPLLVGAAAGALAAAVVGWLLAGWTRGVLFAGATLTFAAACSGALFNVPAFSGPASARSLGAPALGGLDLAGPRYTWVVVVAAAGAFGALRWLGRSRFGAAMLAVREHERAAVALGIPAGSVRWLAFVVTGAMSGLAGALTAFQVQTVAVEQFHLLTALPVLSVAIVGGIESLWGATVGAALLTLGPELLREVSAPALAAALPPAVLLLVVALRPAGLTSLVPAGLPAARLRWPATRWRRAAAIDLRTSSAAGRTLRADGVVVAFGEFRAVDGLTITAEPGEVVALIGPNGAGKTTLFDAVSGFVPLADGRITLGSQRLDRLRPFRRLRAGCGRTFQSGGLFPRLSLRDNVDIPRRWHRLDGPPADELLAAAGVSSPGHTATDVPPGIARTAELVRILALRPGVLLLDEPTAGLARSESDAMVRFVKDRAGDTAVLLIEHDVRVIAATDRVVVMDQGRLLASGPPDEIRRDPAVIAAYLGSAAPPRGPAAAAPLADRPGSAGYGAPIDESAR